MDKKTQIIAEFILMSGIALMVSIIFIFVISQTKELHDTKEFFLLKDIALKIQNEVSITAFADDGYSRQFELPKKIGDRDYNITIKNNTLAVWTNSTSYVTSILNITGSIKKDSNTIAKANGVVSVS